MTVTWDESKIGELLCKAFAARFDRHNPDENKRVTANIDVLITFDSQGVSSHPNHISLYHGARAFVEALVRAGGRSPVDLYTLGSVSLTRKYTSVADAIATLASSWSTVGKADEKHPKGLVFMNKLTGDEPGLRTAWKAMTEAHQSQMVWFRYLWIGFSRYMLINDLQLEEVEAT
jgi:N-acetylglucosaminylphosphatidylinositol deacetylase